jgi:prophage tail gpP-like protein
MPKPIPGKPYTIVSGDTLSGIATRAYGIPSKSRDIYAANETVLKSGDPDLIFPGEVIWVPPDASLEKVKNETVREKNLSGKEPNEFTLLIDDVEFPVDSGRVLRTVDTMADGWTASIAFDTDDQDFVNKLKPYGYQKAEVFLGGKRVITGRLYGIQPSLSKDRRGLNLEGWSYTADLIDSVTKPPYQISKTTLEQRAKGLIEPEGLNVVFESENDGQFNRIKVDKTETISEHLKRLAFQRGILVSSTVFGEPLFYDPATSGSVGTLVEGEATFDSIQTKFDGRQRWNSYTAYGSGPKKNRKSTAKDDNVPLARKTAFIANDTTDGDIKTAAEFKRNQAIADSLTIDLPVGDWYAPNGELWEVNTLVTVISPTLFLPNGFDFLIRSIEYSLQSDSVSAVLKIVPPSVFTRGDIIDPWSD